MGVCANSKHLATCPFLKTIALKKTLTSSMMTGFFLTATFDVLRSGAMLSATTMLLRKENNGTPFFWFVLIKAEPSLKVDVMVIT